MKLVPLKPDEVSRILRSLGFQLIRQKGSHQFWRHADGRTTVLPVHRGRTLPRGTLRDIIREVGLTVDQFMALR